MSVATSARNGATKVPDTMLLTKFRANSGTTRRIRPSTMTNASQIRNTRT
jgi:hypothetical protein